MLFSVSGFKLSFFKFLYDLIRFYSRCELSFRPYLSILALISNLHKIPQTLDLDFHFRLTHLFLLHSFPTPWKYQKKLTVFWRFHGVEKSALGTNGLRYSRGSIPYSLWGVIIFYGIISLGNLNSWTTSPYFGGSIFTVTQVIILTYLLNGASF